MKLSTDEVLQALSKACAGYSAYVSDEVEKIRRKRLERGETGHSFRASLVLARLRQLEADGLVTGSVYPAGFYGFHWTITETGKERLKAIHN